MLGWKRGEGVLRRVSLLVCKMGPVYCPQAYGVGRGQVSESVLVRGLEQSLAHRMCQVHQRPWPSLRPSVVWVRRIRKGRPGGTVVDTDLCPRGASVVGDTVIVWGVVSSPSWGTQPCPRGDCQFRRRGAAPPWVCLVSGEPRPQPGALTPCSPQHCLLGWDIIPPKSEESSAPKSLDLRSSVSPEAHHQKLSATGSPNLVRPGCPGRSRHLGAA